MKILIIQSPSFRLLGVLFVFASFYSNGQMMILAKVNERSVYMSHNQNHEEDLMTLFLVIFFHLALVKLIFDSKFLFFLALVLGLVILLILWKCRPELFDMIFLIYIVLIIFVGPIKLLFILGEAIVNI